MVFCKSGFTERLKKKYFPSLSYQLCERIFLSKSIKFLLNTKQRKKLQWKKWKSISIEKCERHHSFIFRNYILLPRFPPFLLYISLCLALPIMILFYSHSFMPIARMQYGLIKLRNCCLTDWFMTENFFFLSGNLILRFIDEKYDYEQRLSLSVYHIIAYCMIKNDISLSRYIQIYFFFWFPQISLLLVLA